MILPSRNSQETPEDKEKQKKIDRNYMTWCGRARVIEIEGEEMFHHNNRSWTRVTLKWIDFGDGMHINIDKKTKNAITDWI